MIARLDELADVSEDSEQRSVLKRAATSLLRGIARDDGAVNLGAAWLASKGL